MKITGKCLCGAVRWESSEAPIVTRVCWCRECQYLGAGSGTVNACFRTATFTVTGKTTDHVDIANSGNRMHRRFCPVCGTPLFSEAESRAAPHLRPRRDLRRSGPRQARDDHLDRERAELGVHQ